LVRCRAVAIFGLVGRWAEACPVEGLERSPSRRYERSDSGLDRPRAARRQERCRRRQWRSAPPEMGRQPTYLVVPCIQATSPPELVAKPRRQGLPSPDIDLVTGQGDPEGRCGEFRSTRALERDPDG